MEAPPIAEVAHAKRRISTYIRKSKEHSEKQAVKNILAFKNPYERSTIAI
jgi:hypothetical protein